MKVKWFDLQLFADGAGDGAAGGDGGQAAGGNAADAGQDNSIEARLSQLGIPKDKIDKVKNKKGAFKSIPTPPPVEQEAAQPANETAEVSEGETSGAADRKTWEEIKAEYKEEYDAEMQNMVKKRIKNLQDKIQQLEDRDSKAAVAIDFLANKYGMDPANLDMDKFLEAFRNDASLSEAKANELGTTEEIAHKLELAEQDEARREREKERQQQLKETFDRRALANQHFDDLQNQAAALQKKIPGFDLMHELDDDAFAEMTRPGSKISVEAAYYALHPEFRQQEIEAVAQRAREAVSASVRSGSERPRETGTQAASLGSMSPKSMSKEEREALKKRIYDAGYRGQHVQIGG